MQISFNFPSNITLRERTRLKLFIAGIFKRERKRATVLNFVFCSDEYLLTINKNYLSHDYFTDIITFDLSEPGSGLIQGEIYISTETVCSNAERFNTSIKNELHRVIFHGVLHLCGYGDKTKRQQALMSSKEDSYLKSYFNVSRGTILRTL